MATGARARRFFVTHRDWQWIKHLVLADYLRPWSMKVGSTAKQIFVVDAFAGTGTYTHPITQAKTDGSPVIAAVWAREYERTRPGREMRVICVERNAKNHTELEARLAGFGPLVDVRKGTFQRHARSLAATIGNSPALVLLDPIGVTAIDAATCTRLLHRTGKTDVFVIVDFSYVHRVGGHLLPDGTPNPRITTAAKNVANVDSFFAGGAWRQIALDSGVVDRRDRERHYLKLCFDQVLGARYPFKCAFPVRRAYDRPVRYWLVHAAAIVDASELMNDEITKVDRELFIRTFQQPRMLEGIAEAHYTAQHDHLQEDVKAKIRDLVVEAGPQGIAFGHVQRTLFPDYFGRIRTGVYAKMAKQLVREGLIERQQRPAAALRGEEILRERSLAT